MKGYKISKYSPNSEILAEKNAAFGLSYSGSSKIKGRLSGGLSRIRVSNGLNINQRNTCRNGEQLWSRIFAEHTVQGIIHKQIKIPVPDAERSVGFKRAEVKIIVGNSTIAGVVDFPYLFGVAAHPQRTNYAQTYMKRSLIFIAFSIKLQ